MLITKGMTVLQKFKRWVYVKATPLRHKFTYWRLHRGGLKPLKILSFPHYLLQRKASPVTKFDAKLRLLVEKLAFTAENPPWGKAVGLAAPQVGISLQMFIAGPELFINPVVTKTSHEVECKEGCFSLEPGKYDYKVMRAQSVWVKYQGLDGNWKEQKFNGLMAEVVQHEVDHLQGHCLGSDKIKLTAWQKVLFFFQALKYKIKN